MDTNVVLMERETAGLKVSIAYDRSLALTTLVCNLNGREESTGIPGFFARDAFDHPCCYLSKTQVDALGVR